MKEKRFLEQIKPVLRKSRGEPSKFIELLTCILELNREGEMASFPKLVRRMWPKEWQQSEDKVALEQVKWHLLLIRRREINERVFHSHLCFNFFIELSQKKQFCIITDPGEIFRKRLEELEHNLLKARPKANRRKIKARIIELADKFQEFTKEKARVDDERSPAVKNPDKLSISITPFVNMNGNPEQEYFSDGITKNIIMALSKTPNVLVFIPKPTFDCKDKPGKLEQVTWGSGAQYMLKGTVQRIDNRVRIGAQLIDTTVGNYLWAERWDRDLKDIFALQDEIAMKIVEALQVTFTEGKHALAWGRGTDNIQAYIKARQARYHWELMTIEDNILARQLAEQVIALDPEYATGYILLGNACLGNLYLGISDDWSQITERAFQLSQKALALDDANCFAYILLGMVHQCRRQHEQAISAIKRSVALNPNSAICLEELAVSLMFAGCPEMALPLLEKALHFNNFPNSKFFFALGMVYKNLERYEEAILTFKEVIKIQPYHSPALFNLGISYSALGHENEACAAVNAALKVNPGHTLEKEKYIIGLHKDPAYIARSIDLLSKAGLK